MVNVLLRTLIVYTVVSVIMRCMGKRQVGELELTDLVSTVLLSEVAAIPLADSEMPLVRALLPAIVIALLEVNLTFLKAKFNFLKGAMEGRPSILIRNGQPDQAEMLKMRVSIEELLAECRVLGYTDLAEIAYAILEQDGKISIIPTDEKKPLTPKDMHIAAKKAGLAHTLITDGRIHKKELHALGLDEAWLEKECKKRGAGIANTFFLARDDAEKIQFIAKEKG